MRHAARARVPLSAPRATLLVAASGLLVHRRPGAAFGLLPADAATLVAFLDVLRHPLLLARVFRFVAAWHRWPLRMGRAPTRAIRIPSSVHEWRRPSIAPSVHSGHAACTIVCANFWRMR